MTLERPSTEEVDEAIQYIRELRKNPAEYERWLDNVIDKALKGWRSGKRNWKRTTPKTRKS
jgi:hypothetical protein